MQNMPRVFKETQEQIAIQKARGLEISNDVTTKRIIESENYNKLYMSF